MEDGVEGPGLVTRLFEEVTAPSDLLALQLLHSLQLLHPLFQGQYHHLLKRIFLYLDGSTLRCAELVCKQWRRSALGRQKPG